MAEVFPNTSLPCNRRYGVAQKGPALGETERISLYCSGHRADRGPARYPGAPEPVRSCSAVDAKPFGASMQSFVPAANLSAYVVFRRQISVLAAMADITMEPPASRQEMAPTAGCYGGGQSRTECRSLVWRRHDDQEVAASLSTVAVEHSSEKSRTKDAAGAKGVRYQCLASSLIGSEDGARKRGMSAYG